MRKKRALALRKLAGFNPHHPRQYFAVPTGAKRIEARIDLKGVKTTEEKDIFTFVSDKPRTQYQEAKKLWKERGHVK